MILVIAEKPSLGKAIAEALPGRKTSKPGHIEIDGGAICVAWCFGHMLESMQPDEIDVRWKAWSFDTLPITPNPLPLKPIPASKSQLTVLKELCKKADTIVNAGDAGREGELLIREVIEYAKATKKPLKRLWLQETTEAAIKKAWAGLQPGSKYDGLYAAARGRQLGDFWVGMSLSRAWTLAGRGADGANGTVSVGRVQTPTMSIVVRRDLEIEEFTTRDYYEVDGLFEHGVAKFSAKWQPSEAVDLDEENHLLSRSVADAVAKKVSGKRAKVLVCEAKPKRESAPLPFHLGGIQAAASAKYGFTAARTLELMQMLYEERKVLSYPRTECRYLAESQFPEARAVLAAIAKTAPHLAALVAKASSSLKHEAFNDKKMGEHHAIVPTAQAGTYAAFSDEEKKLYDLVAKSYVALFFPDHEYKALVLEVECESEKFRATGKKPTVTGWKEVFGKGDADEEDDAPVLPDVPVGTAIVCKEAKVAAKATKPPARFSDGTLLSAMESVHRYVSDERIKKVLRENQGLGTAATRAAVIERLVGIGYLKRSGKFLVSTDKARRVWKALPKELSEPGLTALFEQELQQVAEGASTLERFLALQSKFVTDQVALAQKSDLEFAAVHQCPKCAKGRLRRIPRKDKSAYFWGCSEYAAGCKTAFNDDDGKPDIEGKTPRTGSSSGSSSASKGKKPAAKPAAKTARKPAARK